MKAFIQKVKGGYYQITISKKERNQTDAVVYFVTDIIDAVTGLKKTTKYCLRTK